MPKAKKSIEGVLLFDGALIKSLFRQLSSFDLGACRSQPSEAFYVQYLFEELNTLFSNSGQPMSSGDAIITFRLSGS